MSLPVPSLLTVALDKITERPDDYLPEVQTLPKHLKDSLRHLLLKRGVMTTTCLRTLLHEGVRDLDMSEFEVTDEHLQCIQLRRPTLVKMNMNHGGPHSVRYKPEALEASMRLLPFLQGTSCT